MCDYNLATIHLFYVAPVHSHRGCFCVQWFDHSCGCLGYGHPNSPVTAIEDPDKTDIRTEGPGVGGHGPTGDGLVSLSSIPLIDCASAGHCR